MNLQFSLESAVSLLEPQYRSVEDKVRYLFGSSEALMHDRPGDKLILTTLPVSCY